jgi:hypothetical protein
MKDGTETDVDCGGDTCPGCGKDGACLAGPDCISGNCLGGACTDPCQDGKKDGTETDIDCGGALCGACVPGQACNVASDCQTNLCMGGKCAAASCTDGVKNNMETDVDCGGLLCPPCKPTQGCLVNKDCDSKVCDTSIHTCKAPTCNDGVQNGNETDIDCGGGCPKCNPGQKCGGNGDCVGGSCNTTCQCPTGMLVVPVQGGGIYCTDATEVTYSQYKKFYDANPPTTSQAAYCSWNQNYTPSGDWPFIVGQDNEPVRFVNWCQADAYCRYNGKRLCGKIGGGSVDPANNDDFLQDQWLNACSAQGQNTYPYGLAYNGMACNGGDLGKTGPVLTSSIVTCVGGVPGLFDMSGNVAEWEDSCSSYTSATDTCAVRGGSYISNSTALSCKSGGNVPAKARNYQGRDVGFRCCL